jgi:hypothetical protein
MNIKLAQKICKRRNHSVLLQRERERELNIVPNKYSSGSYPEFVSLKTYKMDLRKSRIFLNSSA